MPYYNSTGQALSESQDSGVLKRSYQYFASSETMTDSLGRTTVYFSTQTQNLLKPLQIQDPLGNTSAFSYDSDGNRVSMATPDGTNVYSYDPLNRLITAAHPTPSNLPVLNESFSYDPVGNRLADAQISGYNYNAANELVSNSSFTYSYDANGNLISKTDAAGNKTIFSYDSQNELIGASMPSGVSAVYKYDALGRRIFKSTGSLPSQTQQFIYDNQNILAILDGNNNLIALFTHGPGIDEPLEIRQGNGTEYFLHADGLGSIVAATDINGNLVEKIEYESYGQPVFLDVRGASPVVESQSFTQSPFAFTGQPYDPETGMYNYRAREYDSQTGRFIQVDQISLDPAEIATNNQHDNVYNYADRPNTPGTERELNAYNYVANNPDIWSDPEGTGPYRTFKCGPCTITLHPPHYPGQEQHIGWQCKNGSSGYITVTGKPSHGYNGPVPNTVRQCVKKHLGIVLPPLPIHPFCPLPHPLPIVPRIP